jgi:hypothetical protein
MFGGQYVINTGKFQQQFEYGSLGFEQSGEMFRIFLNSFEAS